MEKIASAMATNLEFCDLVASEGKHSFVSTGMSTMDQIEDVIGVFKKEIVQLHYFIQ